MILITGKQGKGKVLTDLLNQKAFNVGKVVLINYTSLQYHFLNTDTMDVVAELKPEKAVAHFLEFQNGFKEYDTIIWLLPNVQYDVDEFKTIERDFDKQVVAMVHCNEDLKVEVL